MAEMRVIVNCRRVRKQSVAIAFDWQTVLASLVSYICLRPYSSLMLQI